MKLSLLILLFAMTLPAITDERGLPVSGNVVERGYETAALKISETASPNSPAAISQSRIDDSYFLNLNDILEEISYREGLDDYEFEDQQFDFPAREFPEAAFEYLSPDLPEFINP